MVALIKFTRTHETVADSIPWDDQLLELLDDQLIEVLAFKIYGPRDIKFDIIVVYAHPSKSFNLDGMLI